MNRPRKFFPCTKPGRCYNDGMGRLKTGKEATIRTQGGKVQRITTATMLAAMERARKYLEEAVRFVRNSTRTPARLVNNTLIGHVIPLEGPGTVE